MTVWRGIGGKMLDKIMTQLGASYEFLPSRPSTLTALLEEKYT